MEKMNKHLKNCIGIFVLLLVAELLGMYLYHIEFQPSGGDIYGHFYKSQVMYNSIKQGNWYPLFDFKWYNGIQLYRYWPPLSYYLMSGLMSLKGGSLIDAYYMFAIFSLFVGGLPWVLWGNMENRRVLGTTLGILWFFMPENIQIYFTDGNMPQMTTLILVPYIIFFLWLFVRKKKNLAGIGLYFGMLLFTVTHLMITALMGVSAFLFLLIDEIWNKDWKRKLQALVIMVTGIMTAGIWVVPSLKGGMVSAEQGGGSVMSMLIYPLSESLNPFNRWCGEIDAYYFGIGVTLLSILGILFAKGKKKAGFILLLIILVLTTPATFGILSKLPFSQLFWMTRFTPMVYGFFFCSMLEWTKLKKKYCKYAIIILLLDLTPSFFVTDFGLHASETIISDIKDMREMTSQRAAVADLSSYGPYPSFGLCADSGVNYTFGWAWQGAATGDNIVLLNEALEKEKYTYLFDRCVELGNDTVLVKKSFLGKNGGAFMGMVRAAERSGYQLVKESTEGYLFKKDTPETFGVISEYKGIVIGKYANAMTTTYPSFIAGKSDNIEDYTLEELSKYEILFLTGFSYDKRDDAEQLLKDVAAKGVRIIIDTTHMPPDPRTKQEKFLGVLNQQIHFEKRYPTLSYVGQNINAVDFIKEDTDFSTGYVANVDHTLGTFKMGGQELTFLGYNNENPNIYFMGINLMYHAVETGDRAVIRMLNQILGVSNEQLPVRELVPIIVEQEGNTISIHSERENVNTTIAYQDIFESNQEIAEENNLLVLKGKNAVIKMHYPMFKAGLMVSILGVLAGIFVMCYRPRKKEN